MFAIVIFFLVYYLFLVGGGVEASPLIISLDHVPYNANLTILCKNIVDVYFTTPPTNVAAYCSTSMFKRTQQYEIYQVKLEHANVTTGLDAPPFELNEALTNDGFFEFDELGEVTLVANFINTIDLIIGVVASATGVTLVSLLTLCCCVTK